MVKLLFLIIVIAVLARVGHRSAPPAASASVGRRRTAVIDVCLVAAAFALLTGWFEIAAVWFRQSVQHRFAFWTLATAWMTPTVYVLLFAVPAVFLAGFGLLRTRWAPLSVSVFVFALLAVLSVSYSLPRVSPYAMAVLALGVATQAARFATAHPAKVRTWARATGSALALVTALVAATSLGWRQMRWARQAAPTPEAGDAPNVLILLLDTVRSESMSLYGYSRETTPNLDRWAESGTVFEWAISPAPWTLGTHASLFTGRWGHELSAGGRTPLDESHRTLAEVLSDAGYATAHIVANARYAGHETGLARGAHHVDDYQGLREPLLSHAWLGQSSGVQGLVGARSAGELAKALVRFSPRVPFQRAIRRRSAAEINEAFLGWVSRVGDRPYYAFLNYFDAHRPHEPPQRFRDRFVGGSTSEAVGLYDATIASLDEEIDVLFRTMDRQGLLENTLIVITSDHGEQVEDRGRSGHGDRLYSQVVRVPLVWIWPSGVPAGTRIGDVVSLRDVAATVLDLLGAGDELPGRSLAGFWNGTRGEDEWVLTELFQGNGPPPDRLFAAGPYQSKALLDQRYHYIWSLERDSLTGSFTKPREELFDYRADPGERIDLASSVENAATLDRFRSELVSWFPLDDPAALPRQTVPP